MNRRDLDAAVTERRRAALAHEMAAREAVSAYQRDDRARMAVEVHLAAATVMEARAHRLGIEYLRRQRNA